MLKRTPLRVQLVATLLMLVTLGLLLSGLAGTTALRNYLVDRVDDQLTETTGGLLKQPGRFGPSRGPGGRGLDPDTEFYVELLNPDGTLFRSGQRMRPAETPLPRLTIAQARARGGKPYTAGAGSSSPVRLLATPLSDGSGTLTVALSLDDVQATVTRLTLIMLVVGIGVLLLLGILGYILVRSSLRPLVEVEETAEAIAAGDLSRRVPERDPRTEVGRLSRALNGMLAQIESAFDRTAQSEATARASEDRMRRFVADASHELRTPLTSIRGFAELYRQGAATRPDEIASSMRRIEDEAFRMGLLVDDLLLLARLDQQRPLERRPVELVELAADAVHDAQVVHPDRAIHLRVLPGDDAPVVLGDESRLRQVISNLVNNAIAHTPVGTVATVTVGVDGSDAVVEVADTGPGLTPEAAARVFERFYRADTSRTRAAGGTGLGLSIVAALVAAHSGSVSVDSEPGHGATFRVRIPLAPTPDVAPVQTARVGTGPAEGPPAG